MSIEGVLVSYNYSSDEEPAKILTVAASGIKFSERWVLTHGSIIAPLKVAETIEKSKGKVINDEFYANLPEIYVTCERKPSEAIYEEVKQLSKERAPVDQNQVDLDHPSYFMRILTGRICHIWECSLIEKCVSAIMYSWAVGLNQGTVEQQSSLGKTLLPLFVLIDLETDHRGYKVLRPLSALLDMVSPPPNRGSRLVVHSTPFGCEAFLNTESQGAVSSLVGPRPSLLLTDAPTAMGSEGGPVFNDEANLIGMVICSVSWWCGEWVGLSLVAPLASVLTAKLHVDPPKSPSPELRRQPSVLLKSIDNSTVLVQCGASWGSGVYLGRGYILTCAHVVRNYELYKVSIYCQRQQEVAIVRYKSTEQRAYDLALLFTDPRRWARLEPAVLAKTPAVKGEPVLAAGFTYFKVNDIEDLLPIVTSGHVSNVSPSLLQTTCCIQSGFSGGPILRVIDQRVEVVGIITSNAKTTDGATHTHINMSIPINLFCEELYQYQEDKDLSRLEVMNNKHEIIHSQWRLLPYRSKI
ncbi:peroxisomal leader peptide-processing protease isoform X2 [Manduca sexta]|uniref:Peroxisomal leader peptide-processing protease n=1 Tax=Manduca sexta TaxID=7130 RepID=A0A922CZA7_MANSE|nr:peroxisomal leader peptide-processing protease isoform X2 [Manduca sexta]KAG6462753.1 hypothetical protein O3G_MSEX013445 [Manduca sexta]